MRYLFIILLCSCSFIDDLNGRIDPLLAPHFNAFLSEAAKRNINIDVSELTLVLSDINDLGEYDNETKTIIISEYAFYKFDSLAIQYVVFHELGHFIGRDHNKNYSIMNPNKYAGDYHNSEIKRVELIDELFKWHS